MVYTNPYMREAWENMSDASRMEGAAGHAAVKSALQSAGALIASAALQEPVTAKVVSRSSSTDGPFAETKEHLAGFYLIEVASEAEALEWAARMPEAEFGMVEVRPIRDLSAYGL